METPTLKIQAEDDNLIPVYGNSDDAGLDVFAKEEVAIPAGATGKVATGVRGVIPKGYVGLVWDRSSVSSKRSLKVLAGVIDAGYRGEWFIVLHNLSGKEQVIEQYTKIAQVLIQPVAHVTIQSVDSLEQSERGEDGFGSTGN